MPAALPFYRISYGDITDGIYTGHLDLSCFAGYVELSEDMGIVQFNDNVKVVGGITAKRGTGIKVIGNLTSESYIRSDDDIICDGDIDATHDLKTRGNIIATGNIKGSTIKAKGSVKTNGKIITSEEINAKGAIAAGMGIEFRVNIFARNSIDYGDGGISVAVTISSFDKEKRFTETRYEEVDINIR